MQNNSEEQSFFNDYDEKDFYSNCYFKEENEGSLYDNFDIEEKYEENQSTDETEKKPNNKISKENFEKIFPFNNPNEETNKQSPQEEITPIIQENHEIQEIPSTNIVIPVVETIKDDKKENQENKINIITDNDSNNNNDKNFLGKKTTLNTIGKKVRIIALKAILYFINEKIKFYFTNIKKGILELQFREISKQNLSKSRAGYDKEFLGLKLKEILSWDISSKFTNILKDYNRKLLDKLLNTEKCGKYFSELFELTFSQCLEHIQEKKNYDLLNGLMNCRKMFETFCDKEEINDENYYLNFETILMTYQNFIGKKSPRKSKKIK